MNGLATAIAWAGSVLFVAKSAEGGLFRTPLGQLSDSALAWATRSVLLDVLGSWPTILLVLPIDVTTIDLPGPPRFVPLAMGLPSQQMMQAANRGEMVLGGCVTTGFEPRWLWVW